MKITRINITVPILVVIFSMAALAGTKDSLKEALLSKCTLTKTGWGDYTRITSPGTIVVIRKDGISADLASDMTSLITQVVDGKPAAPKGAGASRFSKHTTRSLKSGERMYVTKLDIKDDGVLYQLVSVDTFDINREGNTKQTRYKAYLYFRFDKDAFSAMAADDILKVVDELFAPEEQVTAVHTKTIELGQSPDQVESILGKPDKIVNLGPKKIYIYKDTKIVFQDEKVADVQ